MSSPHKIEKQSDLLVGLLTTQCADLEIMVRLERAETLAAQSGDYEKVLKIISEREVLGEKLKTFQLQINKLRERLSKNAELAWESNIAQRMSEVVRSFISQNADKQFLLEVAQRNSFKESSRIGHLQGSPNIYFHEKPNNLACLQ